MHKLAKRPIEVRRVTFSNVVTPLDDPTQVTRAATWKNPSTRQSMTIISTSIQAYFENIVSSDPQRESTTQGTIISDDPASLVIPR